MSAVQKLSRAGWVLVGVVVAVLLFPSVSSAASTVYDGIVGTSGHKADVSPTSQLLTAEAAPSTYYHKQVNGAEDNTVLATPPSGRALIVTAVSIDFSPLTSSSADVYVGNSTCGLLIIGIDDVDASLTWNGSLDVAAGGTQQVPVGPGIAIPGSDRLCADADGHNVVSVAGYSVPSSTVSAPH
jgi:hypothetical protein